MFKKNKYLLCWPAPTLLYEEDSKNMTYHNGFLFEQIPKGIQLYNSKNSKLRLHVGGTPYNTKKSVQIVNVSKRDSSYYTDKDKVVSITYEEIGLFPRSFSRVLDRFLKQLFSDVDNLVIQEYRFYRYLFLTTIKTIFILFFVPFLVNFVAKNYIVKPITEYFWNTNHPEIFLNSYEQKRAFVDFEQFEEKIYFETLVECEIGQNLLGHKISKANFITVDSYPSNHAKNQALLSGVKSQDITSKYNSHIPNLKQASKEDLVLSQTTQLLVANKQNNILFDGADDLSVKPFFSVSLLNQQKNSINPNYYLSVAGTDTSQYTLPTFPIIKKNKDLSKIYQEKAIELATYYNNHSIEAITNFFADLLSLCTLLYLLITLSIQINITKSFLLEVFFGLDDSKKSLLILLITDLLVGYHSSNLWELFFEFIFNHYGIPESQTGIFLLVATLPVLLDVLFKYLIFRHLNRSSPATVATYQAIIE